MLIIFIDLGYLKTVHPIKLSFSRKKGFSIMLIALMDLSCLKILQSSRKGKNTGNFVLSIKEVHHLLIIPLNFDYFENLTSPRKHLEKSVVLEKEVLVNFSAHATHSF